jgi:hypothetical protein
MMALALILGESDDLLGYDAPWRRDLSPQDAARLECELERLFDLLRRKLHRLQQRSDR